jgi:hypothetical protein
MGKRENILKHQAHQEEAIGDAYAQARLSMLQGGFYGQQVLPSENELYSFGLRNQLYNEGIRSQLTDELDMSQISERWKTTFAEPAMNAWWEYNAPGIRDEFAGVAGGFYSTDRAMGVSREASRFMGQNITPTLYSSLEASAARRPGIIGMLGQMGPMYDYQQQIDLSQGAARANINPYLTMLMGQRVNAAPVAQETAKKTPWGMIGGAIGSIWGPAGSMVGSTIGGTIEGNQG